MQVYNLSRWLTAIIAVFPLMICTEGSLAAADKQVADLLDLPSSKNNTALHSLQLAVARAGDRLVSVGERGIVLLTDDNGHSWRQASSVPVSVALTGVSFVSATQGWAIGHSGVVLYSEDGGETWLRQLEGKQVAQIIFDDASQRQALGEEGAAAAVRNAKYLLKEGPDKPFLGVHFSDAKHGWIVGAYGLALRTDDGGKTWKSILSQIPNPRGKHLYQLLKKDNELVIVGEQGALFRSVDGGANFQVIETPYDGTFFGAIDVGEAILAFGLRGNAWRSRDGQTDWQQIELGQPVTLTTALQLNDHSIVLADESGRLMRSLDKGRHFIAVDVPAVAGITGIAQASDGALILSGTRGSKRVESMEFTLENRP